MLSVDFLDRFSKESYSQLIYLDQRFCEDLRRIWYSLRRYFDIDYNRFSKNLIANSIILTREFVKICVEYSIFYVKEYYEMER